MTDGKPSLVLMMGLPCSGKSSYVLEKYKNTHVRLNLDTIKNRDKERVLFFACLSVGVNIVIDNTNMSRKTRNRFIPYALASNYTIEVVHIKTSVDKCIERVIQRAETSDREVIPEKGILGLLGQFEPVDMELENIDTYLEISGD